jgi:hypothetical protein
MEDGAGGSHWRSGPHSDALVDIILACTHLLLFCRAILRGTDNAWGNLVNVLSLQSLNLLTVQPGSMEARLSCEHFFNALSSPNTSAKSMLHTCWTSVCNFRSAEQISSLQMFLESSNDQDHADGNVECRGTGASREAAGDDSNK